MTADRPVYRKLRPAERDQLRAHFLRLDPEDRALRFFGHVNDAFIEAYCARDPLPGTIRLGGFLAGELRAVGELCPEGGFWNRAAEVAITVERPYQDHGIGTEMLSHLIALARNRSIGTLHLFCLLDNTRMQRVARKLGGRLSIGDGEVEARITPAWPSYWSLLEEMLVEGGAAAAPWRPGTRSGTPEASNDNRREAPKQTSGR